MGPANVGGGKSLISVSGPGVAPDGSTVWTLAASPGGWIYSYPDSATWYVVGSLSSSPLASRLQAANITSMDYSYGTVGSETFNIDNNWYTGTLIGVSQVGNALTIVSFTNYSSGKDQSTPVDQITYTLTQ
ncbi:MAG: hypothetical protein JO323_20110 [Acidobacteriia bacterium]|nr:hypothetical protein [Terriglobia bacterium]